MQGSRQSRLRFYFLVTSLEFKLLLQIYAFLYSVGVPACNFDLGEQLTAGDIKKKVTNQSKTF